MSQPLNICLLTGWRGFLKETLQTCVISGVSVILCVYNFGIFGHFGCFGHFGVLVYAFSRVGGMFEGDFEDMCRKCPPPPPDMQAENFSLMLLGGQAEGLACADPLARSPIGMKGNFKFHYYPWLDG